MSSEHFQPLSDLGQLRARELERMARQLERDRQYTPGGTFLDSSAGTVLVPPVAKAASGGTNVTPPYFILTGIDSSTQTIASGGLLPTTLKWAAFSTNAPSVFSLLSSLPVVSSAVQVAKSGLLVYQIGVGIAGPAGTGVVVHQGSVLGQNAEARTYWPGSGVIASLTSTLTGFLDVAAGGNMTSTRVWQNTGGNVTISNGGALGDGSFMLAYCAGYLLEVPSFF